MVSYPYRPLNVESEEIRLISLKPGKADQDIHFDIFHASLVPPPLNTAPNRSSLEQVKKTLPEDWGVKEVLDGRYMFFPRGASGRPNSWKHPDPSFDNSSLDLPTQQPSPDFEPKYDALSYTWGSALDTTTAHVSDPTDPGQRHMQLRIGSNLACALQHLRYQDRPRTLWIDAVCINQNDVSERNAQVKRMGVIYSLAQRVIIWLGPEAEESTLALTTLSYWEAQVEYCTDEQLGDSPGATEPQWWKPKHPLPYDERTWSSLVGLFRKSWFSRVWVLQEALLANRQAIVQCGDASCPWSILRKAILILPGKAGVPQELASLMYSHRHALLGQNKRSIARLILWASYRQCSDPRDKIYGLLSLFPASFQKKIEPQYSNPTLQIYTSTFLAYLDHVKRLELLDQCSIQRQSTGGPSWIPNWAAHDGIRSGNAVVYVRQPSGLSAAQTRLPSPDTLEVVGKNCGRISAVNSAASSHNGHILEAIRLWEPEDLQTKQYVSGCSLLDAFLEVAIQGRTKERYPYAGNFPTLEEIRNEYRALLLGNTSSESGLSYLERFLKIDTLSMLRTQDGYLGVGPQEAQVGDFMCILLGCNRPKLLRGTPTGDFIVVGDCFVHGLMDADSILGPIPHPFRQEYWCPDGFYEVAFYNISTGERSSEDPRLCQLSPEWEIVKRERRQDDPYFFIGEFRNRWTGETMTSDPRMLPDALEQRGVTLERFRLV